MKQVIQHQTWNETAQSWTDVTSEVDVLDADAAAALEAQNRAEYLASCTEEERAEYLAMFPG